MIVKVRSATVGDIVLRFYSGDLSPGDVSHSFRWDAVSNCLIFLSTASLSGPFARSAIFSFSLTFSASI